MGKSTDRTKWTMTYTPGTKYKLTCKDDNFSEREMSVKVPCGGKVMTDDLYVDVKAKAGSITLTGSDISASLEVDYSANTAKVKSGTTTITANITTEGWLASGTTKNVGVSGSTNISTTSESVVPKATPFTVNRGSNNYLDHVDIAAVDMKKIYFNYSWDNQSSSSAMTATWHPLHEIIIGGDDHGNHYCRLGIQYHNDSDLYLEGHATSGSGTSGWSKQTYNSKQYNCFGNMNSGDTLIPWGVAGSKGGKSYEIDGKKYDFKFTMQLVRPATNEKISWGYIYSNSIDPEVGFCYDQEGDTGTYVILKMKPQYEDNWN